MSGKAASAKSIEATFFAELEFDREVEAARWESPSLTYDPKGDRLAFHKSRHLMRCLFTGNGWGKTITAMLEIDAWIQHTNRWQQTPEHGIVAVWLCEKYQQFELLKEVIEKHGLTRGWKWNDNKHCYTWKRKGSFPGGRLWIGSYEADWETYQGIPADIVACDELPPAKLWREMRARKRGEHDTVYIVTATASVPGHFMEKEIYHEWRDYHVARGLSEDEATVQQLHPRIWCKPKGSMQENPYVTAAQWEEFLRNPWSGPKEALVRRYGGFQNWIGDPVIPDQALDAARVRAAKWKARLGGGVSGLLVVKQLPGEPRAHVPSVMDSERSLLRGREFTFMEGSWPGGGRLTIFELPKPRHRYCIGSDFAKGLHGRDYDTAFVIDRQVDPPRQVAAAQGHWGDIFDRVLYPLLRFYNDAFHLGERQGGGIAIMQRLWIEWGYPYQYHNRREGQQGRPATIEVGHTRVEDDVTLRNFISAMIEAKIDLRDEALLDQLGHIKWHHPTEVIEDDRKPDEALRIKLTGGGSPDLAMSAFYGWHAVREVPRFPVIPPSYAKGTLGQVLGHELLDPPKKGGASFAGAASPSRKGRP